MVDRALNELISIFPKKVAALLREPP
jgi:hypothetical protein